MNFSVYIAWLSSMGIVLLAKASPAANSDTELLQMARRQPTDPDSIPLPDSYQYSSASGGFEDSVDEQVYDQVFDDINSNCEFVLNDRQIAYARGMNWNRQYTLPNGGGTLSVSVIAIGTAVIYWDMVDAAMFALWGGPADWTQGQANRWHREPYYELLVQRDFGGGGTPRDETVARVEIVTNEPRDLSFGGFRLDDALQVPRTVMQCDQMLASVGKKKSK